MPIGYYVQYYIGHSGVLEHRICISHASDIVTIVMRMWCIVIARMQFWVYFQYLENCSTCHSQLVIPIRPEQPTIVPTLWCMLPFPLLWPIATLARSGLLLSFYSLPTMSIFRMQCAVSSHPSLSLAKSGCRSQLSLPRPSIFVLTVPDDVHHYSTIPGPFNLIFVA